MKLCGGLKAGHQGGYKQIRILIRILIRIHGLTPKPNLPDLR